MNLMNGQRLGLGTDQMALPQELSSGTPMKRVLPPAQHGVVAPVPHAMPNQRQAAELAPWARRLMLPGVDS